MKWLSFLAVFVVVLSACSSSQKYSNSRYQQQFNTDDAYFSPKDLKRQTAKTKEEKKETPENYNYGGSVYDNTHNETANPNAANRNNNNYTQYTPSTGNSNAPANANSLNTTQNITNNYYNGPGCWRSPSFYQPGLSFAYSNRNSAWYMGPSYSMGFGYHYGCSPWNNGFVYDPFLGMWVMAPYYGFNSGFNNYNSWGYNPYSYNPYHPYSPYSPWGYNPYYGGNSWWGNGGGNNGNVQHTINTRRRPTNNFMPAVNSNNTNGGARVVGSTERKVAMPVNTGDPASNAPQAGATYSGGNTAVPAGNGRNQPNYRQYSGGNAPAAPAGTPTPAAGNASPSQPGTVYNRNAPNNNYNTTPPSTGNSNWNNNNNGNVTPSSPSYNRNGGRAQPSTPSYTPPAHNPSPSAPSGGGGGGHRRR